MKHADHVIAVDDKSTDATPAILRSIAESSGGRLSLISMSVNRGKGHALIAAFKEALEKHDFDVLVTLDGDGQHRPEDIPLLVTARESGADLAIGQRLNTRQMPFRSRIGNQLTTAVIRMVYSDCPTDTQSGFRGHARHFAEMIAATVPGSRYETEMQVLLLALKNRMKVATVTIPTIYLDENASSHFRPLCDSLRIAKCLFRWFFVRPKANG